LKTPVLNATGLSDQNGEITIYHPESAPWLTSAYRENLGVGFHAPGLKEPFPSRPLQVPVVRGDDYVRQHGLDSLTF